MIEALTRVGIQHETFDVVVVYFSGSFHQNADLFLGHYYFQCVKLVMVLMFSQNILLTLTQNHYYVLYCKYFTTNATHLQAHMTC